MDSIGLDQREDNQGFVLKANLDSEAKDLFSDAEVECLDNCALKVFSTEKLMRAYIPNRLSGLKLTQTELERRINNPNDERGPYFYCNDLVDVGEGKPTTQ